MRAQKPASTAVEAFLLKWSKSICTHHFLQPETLALLHICFLGFGYPVCCLAASAVLLHKEVRYGWRKSCLRCECNSVGWICSSSDGSSSLGLNHMWPFFLSPFSVGSDLSEEPSSVSDRSNRQGLLQSSNMGGARDPGFRAHDFIPEFFQFWDPEIIEAASAGSSSPHQSAEESWSHAPDQEEPFFTDMNGHDPVFTLDSHSNYLRKRNIATKASFTPRGLNPKKGRGLHPEPSWWFGQTELLKFLTDRNLQDGLPYPYLVQINSLLFTLWWFCFIDF